MLLLFCRDAYGAVLEESLPDLHGEASSGTAGHIRVNYGGVDQSGQMGAHRRQVAAVRKP